MHLKQKPRRGGGLRQINIKNLPPRLFTGQFLRQPTFGIGVY
jgi:hypothetical protein